jgi:UDP-2-acetamido-3-amino-2,3-dideoxy-glucuronate N-acetyltransferase
MIHPLAEVLTDKIGENTNIWQYTIILAGAKLGSNCNINCQVFIENDVIIGDEVTIKPGVQIWDGMRIGSKVFIGPNATFTNDIAPRSKKYPESFLQTIIEEGVSIGANATIIAGKTIGKYAMVGGGSLVSKNIPPYTLWYGNPAQHKGYITREGLVINLDLKDKQHREYKILNNGEPVLI